MSKKDDDDALLAEFEKMLDGMYEEDDEEDNSMYPFINPRGNPFNGSRKDSGENSTLQKPKETKCRHKKVVKKQLLTSFYFICEDCGEDLK